MKSNRMVLFLCIVLIITFCAPGLAHAEEIKPDKTNFVNSIDSFNGESIFDVGSKILTKDDLYISKEVAYLIAQLFIADMVSTRATEWLENTQIINAVVMYDNTGTDYITAYTFELNTGYVVVAAHMDVPFVILEWSDTGVPVYKASNMDTNSKVVYLGVLDYYIDNGVGALKTLDDRSVERTSVKNHLEEKRSVYWSTPRSVHRNRVRIGIDSGRPKC